MSTVSDIKEQLNWHWRNSMRPIRFFGLDARSALPVILILPFFRIVTIVLALLVVFFFLFLEKRGLSFSAAMRASRILIFGENRPALMSFKYRTLKDFG
jgi:intracellular multiplication protein IcmT